MTNSYFPSISVVMTVYNAEPFIDEAIKSILSQTFSDYEFIIVDDGSIDKSVSLIRQYTDQRIVFYPRMHYGRAATLNYAVASAKSPLIAFMDADDIAMKERLSVQYSIADQHPEIGVLSNWFYRITAAGQVKRLVKLPEKHDAIETMMTRSCSILFGSSMIRKSLIEQIRGFDCQHYAEDWDLFLKLLPLTRFYNVQEPLLFYRQHSNTITGRYRVFQRQDSYVISHDYLLRKLESANSLIERRQIVFRLAVSEISLGTITSARKYLLEAFKIGERSFYWLVYFIFCLLGDRNVSFMRNVRDTAKRVILRYGWNVK